MESTFHQQEELLQAILSNRSLFVCDYLAKRDCLAIYDETLKIAKEIPDFSSYLESQSSIHPDDRWKLRKLLSGQDHTEIEVREMKADSVRKLLIQVFPLNGVDPSVRLPIVIQDITQEKHREALLENRAMKDSLTMLYNHFFGRELINEYLNGKDPYSSCGLMVLDIDYFKYANDTYGHLFGNQVLVTLARLLLRLFSEKSILMRAGGDEFVIFLKDISHADLVKKAMHLIKTVRELVFEGKDYSITCSVGVCFLEANNSGYSYDQLFENADWALYRAKENGRNCYVFCDSLQRFELSEQHQPSLGDIDIRYLHNDIISTAFEIFEKKNSFSVAIELLMEVIGYRFQLDRITVIRTDIKDRTTGRQYQWVSKDAPPVLSTPASFTKEDFLTLFQSYDENQTTVLQHDNLRMYSPGGASLLMQGGAKTVLYAAMYCEGKYTGAISYVVCREKRYWSKQHRKELGEVTKIISAHLARNQAVSHKEEWKIAWSEYDSLTGLISFSRFNEEAERMIVGHFADSYMMLYSDFVGFKYFNQSCGYSVGDQLLKEYSNFFIDKMPTDTDAFFTRIVSDQFLMLLPYSEDEDVAKKLDNLNREFLRLQAGKFRVPEIRIRTGIYLIEPGCLGASYAIDAANYARKQITSHSTSTVRIYDQELRRKQELENEIINGIGNVIREKQFEVYFQPRFSMRTGEVTGAEALVRWRTKDGTLLLPNVFIPLCESTSRIEELDYHVFEQVAAFLARNQQLGRKQVPISVNASILHASDPFAVQKYLDILKKYQVDPKYTEIELTETATVQEYESARRWFQELQAAGIRTALDDFGAGYSVLNSILDIPVNTVKMDRAFIQNCEHNPRGDFFLYKLVDIIRGLGYHVVCEGVETQRQYQILKDSGCDEVQGSLLAKPMSIAEYEKFMQQNGQTKEDMPMHHNILSPIH